MSANPLERKGIGNTWKTMSWFDMSNHRLRRVVAEPRAHEHPLGDPAAGDIDLSRILD